MNYLPDELDGEPELEPKGELEPEDEPEPELDGGGAFGLGTHALLRGGCVIVDAFR